MTKPVGNNPRVCWTVVWQVGLAFEDDPTSIIGLGGGIFRVLEDNLVGLWVVYHEVPLMEPTYGALREYVAGVSGSPVEHGVHEPGDAVPAHV